MARGRWMQESDSLCQNSHPLVAEIVLADFLGGKRCAQHVACFCQVACGAIVKADFYLVVIKAIHVFAYFYVGNEVVGIVC